MQDVGNAKIDLYRGFRPTESQRRFLVSKARGRLMSSGYGSGKSLTGCREGICWAAKYPGSRGLIGRRIADELATTTMVTFWKSMDKIGFLAGTPEQVKAGRAHYTHNKAERYIDFWNRSRIYYRHLDDPQSLGSLELNWAFIDEGAEVEDDIYKTISSSRLRWHIDGCDQADRVVAMIEAGASDEQVMAVACNCPYGIWVCTNPGASGYLRAVTEGMVEDWEWIRAKPGDNPYNGPDYYAKMQRDRKINGEVWFKKFYEGDWGAFEGQRFTMFDESRHLIDVEWRPTAEHRVVCGWDFGHVETFVSFMAYLPDSSEPVVVFDEVVVNEVQEPGQVADAVKAKLGEYRVSQSQIVMLGDPAGVASSQFSKISPISAYAALGLGIGPCKQGKNPVDRANLLAAYLVENRIQPDGSIWPGIVFVKQRTRRTVNSVVNLRWKPQTGRVGEDPREVFLDKNKHGFDGLTYGIYAVPPPGAPAQEKRPLAGANLSARDAWRASSEPEVWEEL